LFWRVAQGENIKLLEIPLNYFIFFYAQIIIAMYKTLHWICRGLIFRVAGLILLAVCFLIAVRVDTTFASEDFKKYRETVYSRIEEQQQAIKKNPKDSQSYFQLGIAYQSLGKHQEELEAYKKAVELKPDFADAHFNLGVTYDTLRDGPNAIRHVIKAEALYQKSRKHSSIRKSRRKLRMLSLRYNLEIENFMPEEQE
jgi:tetratricopeptide (TPR) repeat protein